MEARLIIERLKDPRKEVWCPLLTFSTTRCVCVCLKKNRPSNSLGVYPAVKASGSRVLGLRVYCARGFGF